MRFLGFAVTLAACGGTSTASSPLVGDWWECSDLACSSWDQDAIRFNDDGTFIGLRVVGTYAPPEPYCGSTSTNSNGTYTLDAADHMVLAYQNGSSEGATITFHDDMFDVHADNNARTWYRRIAPQMYTGLCTQ